MPADAKIDKAALRELLADARERIERAAPKAGKARDANAQNRAYSRYEAALEAAGAARGLGEPSSEVRKLLKVAADAAAAVFDLRGTASSTVAHLPEGEEETFVDTSLTDQWTLVQAIYAALASGNDAAFARLAALRPEDHHSEQVEAPPSLEHFSAALREAAGGKLRRAQQAPPERSDWERSNDAADRYWLAQLRVLEHLAASDHTAAAAAITALEQELKRYYAGPRHRDDPERLLELPLLGLSALGEQLKVLKREEP
jgi:hypothetical protein